jgi:sugar-specific transcriptional regulator TrmB
MVDSGKRALSVEESQLNALRHIGLTEYESRLYLVLVKMGPVKASELSFRAQIPRTKAYGAINELERKGLLRIIPGKPDVYSPASPGEVLMPIVNKLSRQLTEAESVIEGLMLTFETNRFVKRDGPKEADGFWEVEGRPGVINKLNQIFSDASKSVNYCTSATGLVRAYKAHCDILEKASDRGVAVRIIAPVNSENAVVAREIAEVLEFKSIDKPFGQNFVTVDSRELIVMEILPEDLRTDQGADKGIWTTNRLVVELHGELFERLWNAIPTRRLPPQTA